MTLLAGTYLVLKAALTLILWLDSVFTLALKDIIKHTPWNWNFVSSQCIDMIWIWLTLKALGHVKVLGGFHSPPPLKSLIQTIYRIKTWRADSLYYYLQNMLVWKPSDNKWLHCQAQWQNLDLREARQIIHHWHGFVESYPKMYLLLTLSYYVESYGHVCQILASFTMPFHQIWSCYLTPSYKFRNFLTLAWFCIEW